MAPEYKPFPLSCEHMVEIIFNLRKAKELGITTNQHFCIVDREPAPDLMPYYYDPITESEKINRYHTFNLTFYWNKTIKDFVLLNIVRHDT